MSEDGSEFITNASQIKSVSQADLPKKPHALEGLEKVNGKTPKGMVCALSVGEYDDYLDEARKDLKNEESLLVWWAFRDPKRNNLWASAEDAVAQIRTWPLPVKVALKNAINEINGPKTVKDAEKNSSSDPSGSHSSSSATTSESGTSTD